MRVLYLGPDEWGAQRVAKRYKEALSEDFPTPAGEAPPLDRCEPLTIEPEQIPEDDPDYPEFKWRVVALTDRELAGRG